MYITYRSHGISHVHTSGDAGRNWTDISGTDPATRLPDVPAHRVVVRMGAAETLYVVTDVGVFRTLDRGGHWEPFDEGLPNAIATDLAYRSSQELLIASTYGRGMYARRV